MGLTEKWRLVKYNKGVKYQLFQSLFPKTKNLKTIKSST